jgi:hypothetical protein
MLKVTGGKGFQMTFANGWTVSVQWGSGNYSDHYSRIARDGESWENVERSVGEQGSKTAEIAAWDASKTWYNFGGDLVKGYVSADEVAEFIHLIASK